MAGILTWLFPDSQGFEVLQEDLAGNGRPDFCVFKISCRPGGSDHAYVFCIVESKAAGEPWGATVDQCWDYCADSSNESDQTYGIAHVGLEVQF